MGETNIGWAIQAMKDGMRVKRAEWDTGTWVALWPQNNELTTPFFAGKTTTGAITAWTPTTTDLLANDWTATE